MELPVLLTTLGVLLVGLATDVHHTRPFREIDHIEWPFMILFIVFEVLGSVLTFLALRKTGEAD